MEQSTLNFIYFLAAIGGIWFLIFCVKLLWAIIKAILPSKNYSQRYGEQTWAIVTGGSDGIGLGFCEQLAALGFNICMIARNKAKMEDALKKIRQNNEGGIRTYSVVADFSECQNESFFTKIFRELEEQGILKDASILVNNVGISNIGYLHQIPDKRLFNEININCVPMVFMSSYIIPHMLKRKYRSAIINVSSLAGQNPIPYVSVYSATKAFNDFFSRSIEMEYSNQIDVLSLRPMLVQSNMSKQKKSWQVASRNQCAQSALKYLGNDYETNGYWIHRCIASIVRSLPTPIVRASSESESKKIMEKEKNQMK